MSVCLSLQGSFKEEPFQFSGQQDPQVQTDRQKDRYCQFIIRIKTPYFYFIQFFFLFFGGSVSHPSIKQLKTTTGPIFTYSYYIQELEKEDKAPSHQLYTLCNIYILFVMFIIIFRSWRRKTKPPATSYILFVTFIYSL